MAPNMFHIGVQEKVSVTVFDAPQPVTVKLYLQDYPHRQKTFSEVQGVVANGNLTLVNRKKFFFFFHATIPSVKFLIIFFPFFR